MTQHITFPRYFTLVLLLTFLGLSLSAQTPKAVDLGLSVKWADCNLGANTPEQEGDPYAYGELKTKGKEQFTFDNYEWKKKGVLKDNVSVYKNSFFETLGLKEEFWFKGGGNSTNVKETWVRHIKPQYDVCTFHLGKGWRLPTIKEWMELYRSCKLSIVEINGSRCMKVVSENGNSILIPAAGHYGTNGDSKRKKSVKTNKNEWDYLSSDQTIHKFDKTTEKEGDWFFQDSESTELSIFHAYKFREDILGISSSTSPWNGLPVRAVYDPSLVDDNNKNDDKRIDPKPDPKPNPDPSPVADKDKPELTVIGWSESTHSPKITLKVGVKSKTAITGSTVTVNGEQTRGIKAVNNDGYDMMIRQEINLRDGTNTVKVEVTNGAGTSSKTAQVFYMPVVEDDKKEVVQQLRKVAYVVGNSAYPGNELPNPKNDASDISAKLRSLGFEVITLIDGTRRQIEDGISTFSRKAADADVAMFFYAGHGIQYNGANYLIPVDAVLRSAKDIDYECTDVNRLLANMEESGCKMNIIALDACRNNPFERGWYRGSTSRGLSAINAPVGTFISYATSPGSVAADGTTRNSPYTSALLSVLNEKGLPIETVFKRVAEQVFEATDHRQTPWYSSSLFKGEFIFNPVN